MRLHILHRLPLAVSLIATFLVVAACGSTATVTVSGGTPGAGTPSSGTATATHSGPTPTPVPPQTLTWDKTSASGVADVWASIAGGPAHQVSHNPGTDPCGESIFGLPVFSPDGAHVAVTGGSGCGDGQSHGPVYIVTVSSGAVTAVPGADGFTDTRSVGWLDNSTIWFAGSGIDTYVLGASGATALPGTSNALEAVIRGGTLFYLAFSGTGAPLSGAIHRYDLSSRVDLGSPISLGSFNLPTDSSPGNFHFQGWDVSHDGAHVVYQVTTAAAVTDTTSAGIGSSHVYYANADGSSRSQILQYMTTNQMIGMRLSPDGSQVAVAGAEPLPDIITGCVASPGTHGDPCFHAYTLPAGNISGGYPIWSPEGNAFVVAGGGSGPTGSNLYRFTVGRASGIVLQTNSYKPWAN